MMKHLFLWTCTAFLLLAGNAQAQTVTLDGIIYAIHAASGTATVTGHTGNPADVAIPFTVEYKRAAYAVTSIGDQAFQYRHKMRHVRIPEGITRIGRQAFQYCTSLQSISIPEGTAGIGHQAFYCCTSLESATLPGSLQSIGEHAFGHTKLKDIRCLSATAPSIKANTFSRDIRENAILHVPSEAAQEAYRHSAGWKGFAHILPDATVPAAPPASGTQ